MEKTVNPFSDSILLLRRRSVWEAVDSGILLWKNSFVYFLPFFALPVWICACGLRLLPADFRYLSYFALWWLKPLFDRLVLHILSRRFFDAPAPSRFGDLSLGLFRNLLRGLLGDLLWRRFSPYRSARMPLRVLERACGKQFRLRKKALAPGGLDFCFILSCFGFVLEGMLLLGEVIFTMMAVQMFFPTVYSYIGSNTEAVEVFVFIAFCFNFLLVETLYVCMGFGLYINSRVEVEGWDLQLLFQKFVASNAPGSGNKPPASVGKVLFLLCLFLFQSPGIRADSKEAEPSSREEITSLVETGEEESGAPIEYFPESFPLPREESLKELEMVLASPDFGSEREGWSIRFKGFGEEWKMPEMDSLPWFENIRRIFGFMLRSLLILAAAVFVGFVFYRLQKYRIKKEIRLPGGEKTFVNPLLSPESPELLFARAEDFFRKGMPREAWAACFAGCLSAYKKYRFLSFPHDATEYGCLERIRSALPSEARSFGELVRIWVLFAYGGRTPVREDFGRALAYGRTLLEISRETLVESPGGSDEP